MAPDVRESMLGSVQTKQSEGPVGRRGSLRPTEDQAQRAQSMETWAQTTSQSLRPFQKAAEDSVSGHPLTGEEELGQDQG